MWIIHILNSLVTITDYCIGKFTDKGYKELRIYHKAEKNTWIDWSFLPAIPGPGNSHRVHASYRLAFVRLYYNLKTKIRF